MITFPRDDIMWVLGQAYATMCLATEQGDTTLGWDMQGVSDNIGESGELQGVSVRGDD